MNKTLITLGFLILILGAIAGNIVLAIIAPGQMDRFNAAMLTILGVGSTTVVLFYGLGTQGEKLKRIESNTNGNLTTMVEENRRLTNIIVEAGLDVDVAQSTILPPHERSTIPQTETSGRHEAGTT